jgi:hypothetical protein
MPIVIGTAPAIANLAAPWRAASRPLSGAVRKPTTVKAAKAQPVVVADRPNPTGAVVGDWSIRGLTTGKAPMTPSARTRRRRQLGEDQDRDENPCAATDGCGLRRLRGGGRFVKAMAHLSLRRDAVGRGLRGEPRGRTDCGLCRRRRPGGSR